MKSLLDSRVRCYDALRVKPDLFRSLLTELKPYMTVGRSLTVDEELGIGLSWLAQGMTFRMQAEMFGRSRDSLKRREEFIYAVLGRFKRTIQPGTYV